MRVNLQVESKEDSSSNIRNRFGMNWIGKRNLYIGDKFLGLVLIEMLLKIDREMLYPLSGWKGDERRGERMKSFISYKNFFWGKSKEISSIWWKINARGRKLIWKSGRKIAERFEKPLAGVLSLIITKLEIFSIRNWVKFLISTSRKLMIFVRIMIIWCLIT